MTANEDPDEGGPPRAVPPGERDDYEAMLLLERLESLLEDMEELEIESRQQLQRRIEALHLRLSQDRR